MPLPYRKGRHRTDGLTGEHGDRLQTRGAVGDARLRKFFGREEAVELLRRTLPWGLGTALRRAVSPRFWRADVEISFDYVRGPAVVEVHEVVAHRHRMRHVLGVFSTVPSRLL